MIRERHFPYRAAALEGRMPPRMVHQDATHQAGGDREELDAVLPAETAEIHQTQVGLVDESRGCQRVIAALGPEAPARDPPQIGVHGLDQATVCGRVSLTPRHEPRGDVILGHALMLWSDCQVMLASPIVACLCRMEHCG